MKHPLCYLLLLSCALVLAACGVSRPFDLSDAVSAEIEDAQTGTTAVLTAEEDISRLVENLHSLRLEKQEYSEPSLPEYTLRFYGAGGELVSQLQLPYRMPWIGCGGWDYAITEGSMDRAFLHEKIRAAVRPFSYEKDRSVYGDGPGSRQEGFAVTAPREIESTMDAVQQASVECAVEYDTTTVYYDAAENMWMVLFHIKNTAGGGQSVYLDSSGMTQLIVYGE